MSAPGVDMSRGSTPHLPPIDAGYDTPGSDYMSAMRARQTLASGSDKGSFCHVKTSSARRGDDPFVNRKTTNCGCSREHDITNIKPQENGQDPNEKLMLSRKSIVRELTMPATNFAKHGVAGKSASDAGAYACTSPHKHNHPGSGSTKRRMSVRSIPKIRLTTAWNAPPITDVRYQEAKRRLLEGSGKFSGQMRRYFREEVPWWEQVPDSDDDDYDTDLDTHIGFALIADEKSREIIQEGMFPEYKQECRKYKSNPNSYLMRHGLDDEVSMKHRYLNEGDSKTISNLVKNHLTLGCLNLDDNGLGPEGMRHLSLILHGNAHLTELVLSRNKLSPMGAKQLRLALIHNSFLSRLDISENCFGDKGGKYCGLIIEENSSIKELCISGNGIGDEGARYIGKALGGNKCLKALDISWNNIRSTGAVRLADGLKRNSGVEIFLASHNGFGDEGGKAVIQSFRKSGVIKALDLAANRMTEVVLKSLTHTRDNIESLCSLNLTGNSFPARQTIDFLTGLLSSPGSLVYIGLQVTPVTEDVRGVVKALQTVHNIVVEFADPPAHRHVTRDVLTSNLIQVAMFMDREGLAVDDLFPDWEDEDEDCMLMITVDEVFTAIECCGRLAKFDKLQKLKQKLLFGKKRKFSIYEFSKVYEQIVCGKDPMREQPLRTHLRRSLKEEQEEKERQQRKKARKRRPVGGLTDTADA
ncbi:leucine-rich repeat-containing protein 74A-like [Mya arenaria]|uniref:leucine-rich repeat-containing protein 74A-like n=1 Tax=Mya arenaria TaxID=6604 RepID=UPI0022DF02C6|nr:leucine-rich repeat-containing protein 74A-like [Mya arenaria]